MRPLALAVPCALFLLALAPRLLGLHWGLPDATHWASYHPDESNSQLVGPVARILDGNFNPGFFNYPSLSLYATALIYSVLALFGLSTDAPTPQYPWPLVRDVIFAGRLFSALCGAATAVVVWALARELGLKRGAIGAAILVALAPGLVQHAHFATVDVPATFFVSLVLWFTAHALSKKKADSKVFSKSATRILLWAGLFSGLAAGTKYNAALVLATPFLGAILISKRPWWIFPALLGLFFLGFFASTPFALLSFREFWGEGENGFAYELFRHPREGSGQIFQNTGLGWVFHLFFNLPFAVTTPTLIFGIVGALVAAKNRQMWPSLAFGALYFIIIGFSQVRFMRYTFFLVPLLVIWAMVLASRLPKPAIWATVLIGCALWGAKDALLPLVSTDPRDQAAAFLKSLSLSPVLIDKPWFYTPPFQPQNFNAPVAGVVSIQLDAQKFDPQTQALVVSQFEAADAVRVEPNGEMARFLAAIEAKIAAQNLQNRSQTRLNFKSFGPFEISDETIARSWPQVPHDYLYTNPQIRVYAAN